MGGPKVRDTHDNIALDKRISNKNVTLACFETNIMKEIQCETKNSDMVTKSYEKLIIHPSGRCSEGRPREREKTLRNSKM